MRNRNDRDRASSCEHRRSLRIERISRKQVTQITE